MNNLLYYNPETLSNINNYHKLSRQKYENNRISKNSIMIKISNTKQYVLFISIFLIIFFLIYLNGLGKSGGDIFINAASLIMLLIQTVIFGIITFKIDVKDKLGVILGFTSSIIIWYILMKYFVN